MKVLIYALLDENEVFYIGKTANISRRLKQHIDQSVRLWNEKDRKIQDILLSGRQLSHSILSEVDISIADKEESETIRKYIQEGSPLLNCMLYRVKRKKDEIIGGLNKSQRLVLTWLSEDKTSEEIGRLIGKSPRTVETIRQNIRKVAKVKTIPGLMIWAVRQGLVAI